VILTHVRILTHGGLVRAKRIKQWTFSKRDEKRIVDGSVAIRLVRKFADSASGDWTL
jgi:hypothetical protein